MSTETALPSIAAWTRDWAEHAGLACWYAEKTESTNAIAKGDLLNENRSAFAPVLYVTHDQNAGRGRGQNSWTCTPGGGLTATWSFHMARPPQPVFSPLIGLAIYSAAMKTWPNLPWSLKAPNDLYLAGGKVAGVLIETIEMGNVRRSIVGLGMNVFAAPEDVETSICISKALGSPDLMTFADWSKFLQTLMVNFMAALPKGQRGEIDASDASALATALNRFPHLKEKILKVGKNGELHTPSGIIDWHTL